MIYRKKCTMIFKFFEMYKYLMVYVCESVYQKICNTENNSEHNTDFKTKSFMNMIIYFWLTFKFHILKYDPMLKKKKCFSFKMKKTQHKLHLIHFSPVRCKISHIFFSLQHDHTLFGYFKYPEEVESRSWTCRTEIRLLLQRCCTHKRRFQQISFWSVASVE